jgi:beta-fructofuranosidase
LENRYKNSFHIEPSKGLLNDPNGLIQFDEKYYFFHQWNRFDTSHSYKEWGLFVSDNLIDWEEMGSALLPDCLEDKSGVYSGSAIEHDKQLFIFYTGNSNINNNRQTYQRTAVSIDGQTFVKQENSIKTPKGITEHHRDPKVWKYQEYWWMIVGAQTEEEVGAVTLFKSQDLSSWTYEGIVFTHLILDQMCECPDYFMLNDNIEILTVCPQKRTKIKDYFEVSSYAAYYVGKMDYVNKKFIPETDIKLLDYGFDFYAPQTFLDDKNRRIMVGWMSRMDEEQEHKCPTKKFGYLHCLTMPRELRWINNQLYQVPLEEFINLRKNNIVISNRSGVYRNTKQLFEIIIEFQKTTNEFFLNLKSNDLQIKYFNKKFMVSRKSWINDKREIKTLEIEELRQVQIFCDASTVEIFINEGQYVLSMRTFSNLENKDIEFKNSNNNFTINFYPFEEEIK